MDYVYLDPLDVNKFVADVQAITLDAASRRRCQETKLHSYDARRMPPQACGRPETMLDPEPHETNDHRCVR